MKNIILFLAFSAGFQAVFATNYYISSTGNDANSGTSPADAWLTINKVNAFVFSPGDSVAFEGGSTFTGAIYNVSIKGMSGSQSAITSYGTGKATISSGVENGIIVYNTQYVSISNLIFQGAGYKLTPTNINGVYVDIDDAAADSAYNMFVDNVECMGYGGWGIAMSQDGYLTGYSNMQVTNCLAHDNGIGGIIITGGYDASYNLFFTINQLYLAHCKAYNNLGRSDFTFNWSGSGILVSGTQTGVIEYCEAYNNGVENGSTAAGPVGIFLSDSRNLLVRNCSSHNNKGGANKRDGGGFDLDQGSAECIIEDCESYENEGAGYGLYQAATNNPWKNNIVRNNSSTNDASNSLYGAFTVWGSGTIYRVVNAQVYGNSISLNRPGYGLVFLNNNLDSALVHDNSFCLESTASYLNYGAYELPIPLNAYVYNNSFPCTVKPQSPFIIPVNYRGAFAPSPTSMWTGFTNYDPANFAYSTIIDSTITTPITANLTLLGTKRYFIKGPIYVTNNAVLTIQAGALIRADKNTPNTSLIITKGSKIYAVGISSKPIIFTSSQAAGQRAAGDWGGIYILGKASINSSGGTANIPGFPVNANTEFGGGNLPNDNDSSGVMQYVRIEFAGSAPSGIQNDGLVFAGTGRGTIADHIQVSYSKNNAFRWTGGAINCRYLLAYRNANDNWNVTSGYHGAVQYALGLKDPNFYTTLASDKTNGLSAENDSLASASQPFSSALFTNVTEIGPLRGNPAASVNSAFQGAVYYGKNSRVKLLNSILMDYPTGVEMSGDATIAAVANGYVMPANQSPGKPIFKNNLVAGTQTGKVTKTDGSWNMQKWFTANLNDSLRLTDSILTTPYKLGTNGSYTGDYRPLANSPALKNTNWSDSAFYYIDSSAKLTNLIACPIVAGVPGVITGPTDVSNNVAYGDTVKYYQATKSIQGILQSNWSVPAGATIIGGQGTDTIWVKYSSTFQGGTISVANLTYCNVSTAARQLSVQKAVPVIFTFTGSGNWNDASNWLNGKIPPAILVAPSEIIIDHADGGNCILNMPQTVSQGAKLTVKAGKNLLVQGGLTQN